MIYGPQKKRRGAGKKVKTQLLRQHQLAGSFNPPTPYLLSAPHHAPDRSTCVAASDFPPPPLSARYRWVALSDGSIKIRRRYHGRQRYRSTTNPPVLPHTHTHTQKQKGRGEWLLLHRHMLSWVGPKDLSTSAVSNFNIVHGHTGARISVCRPLRRSHLRPFSIRSDGGWTGERIFRRLELQGEQIKRFLKRGIANHSVQWLRL